MKYLKAPKSKAESIRKELIAQGAFDPKYPIIKEAEFIFFPLKGISKKLKFEVVEIESEKRVVFPSSIRDVLSSVLTPVEMEDMVSSFDIIGNIAIIEIPVTLQYREKEIADAILKTHKSVKTVFKKLSAMEGEFRVRKLALIAGENNSIATYKENGVTLKFDVSKVYFSVRNAFERKRISSLVKSKEKILVMFAGVGPYCLTIAKDHPDSQIVGIELNPDAITYFTQNVKLNKFKNIQIEQGDVREIIFQKYQKWANRIVMPLPKLSHEFLESAFMASKKGTIIHFYTIVPLENSFIEAEKLFLEKAKEFGVEYEVLDWRITKSYSSKEVHIVLDLKIK